MVIKFNSNLKINNSLNKIVKPTNMITADAADVYRLMINLNNNPPHTA